MMGLVVRPMDIDQVEVARIAVTLIRCISQKLPGQACTEKYHEIAPTA